MFFDKETAEYVINNFEKPKIITATNVFAHVIDLDNFMSGIKLILSDKGVFVSESHYLLNLIQELQYDSIYHEHLRYYSLKSLIYLFNLYDMDVFDAKIVDSHGGSIRVYACNKGEFNISDNINNILSIEEKAGLYSLNTFLDYSKKVYEWKKEIRKLLFDIKNNNNRIVCIGAPAKGNTLLNFCKIDSDLIDYLAEYTKLKIGKYSPGMHIKVEDEERMFKEQPEYSILLSWNLKDIIVPKLRAKGYKGKIIVPIPHPVIIE